MIILLEKPALIHFLMINNPFYVVASYNAPFLLNSFFRVANNLVQKWRQIQILR